MKKKIKFDKGNVVSVNSWEGVMFRGPGRKINEELGTFENMKLKDIVISEIPREYDRYYFAKGVDVSVNYREHKDFFKRYNLEKGRLHLIGKLISSKQVAKETGEDYWDYGHFSFQDYYIKTRCGQYERGDPEKIVLVDDEFPKKMSRSELENLLRKK